MPTTRKKEAMKIGNENDIKATAKSAS